MYKANAKIAVKQENNSELLHLSCWEAIDIAYSQHVLLEGYIQCYNENLETSSLVKDSIGRTRAYTAGKLRVPQTALAQKLIWMAMTEAEETRRAAIGGDTAAKQKYLMYYGDTADSIPVTTNRGELRRLLGKKNGLSSIWRHLNQLQEAGIILSKANTSRQRREIIEEDGHRTIIVAMAENGRGDFTLWINRAVFKQKLNLSTDPGHNEKPSIETLQISKLQQLYLEKKETKKIKKNNPGKQGEEGVASPHERLKEANASDKKRRNEQTKNYFGGAAAAGGKIVKKSRNSGSGLVLPIKDPKAFTQERYQKEMRRNEHILAHLFADGSTMGYWTLILYHQLVEMLYGHLPVGYLESISDKVRGLLELHIRRIEIAGAKTQDDHIQQAACKVSRAIYLAHVWVAKQEKFNIYEPLTYLRLDDGMKNGLRDVVDKWLHSEDKRRQLRADKNTHLFRWQQGEAYAENLFRDVMFTLKKSGYYQATAIFQEALVKLNKKLQKIEASESTATKVRSAFADKCTGIFHAIQEATFEEEDPTWNDFLRYRKSL